MIASDNLERVLRKISLWLRAWRAHVLLVWGIAALLAAAAVLGLADIGLRMSLMGRASSAAFMAAILAATVWLIIKKLTKRFSPDGVAALVEKACPELDNRLINYLQFARSATDDPFKAAYISSGPPDLARLNYSGIRNRKSQLRGLAALLLAGLILVVPYFSFGQAWTVAIQRILNPFAAIEPLTLTRILEVRPGNTTIKQGSQAILTALVDGYPGHKVSIEIHPADSARAIYSLGKIAQAGIQEFSYSLPRVNTDVRYRFRAGDASPSEWKTLTARLPPSLTSIKADITPPSYMRRPAFSIDARYEELLIPFGSLLNLSITGSEGLATVNAKAPNGEIMELINEDGKWLGGFFFTEPGQLIITAKDAYESSMMEEIACRVEMDEAPTIEIISPAGRSMLPPGETPRIVFLVKDDYALGEIALEQIDQDQPEDADGTVLERWDAAKAREYRGVWKDQRYARSNEVAIFRLTASDENPFKKHTTRSAPIVFNVPPEDKIADSRIEYEKQAMARLGEVIELQKNNVDQTRSIRNDLNSSSLEAWKPVLERQKRVLSLTRELLLNPIHPLGGQTEQVNKLFLNEMPLAIAALQTASVSKGAGLNASSAEALRLQETILRGLYAAEVAAERTADSRTLSGLNAMLDLLINNQTDSLKKSKSFAESRSKISPLLVDKQDALASDTADFIKACRRESASVRQNDADFADTLDQMAKEAERRAIRNDMLLAAERLERNSPAEAVPFAARALDNLKALRDLLEGIRVKQMNEEQAVMTDALGQAKYKVDAVRQLHEQLILSMEAVRGQADQNDIPFDVFMEEYKELLKNTKNTMLTVPVDLHIFTDLNAANELIEDVFSVFEEVEQALGTENLPVEMLIEHAYVKEKEMLDQMGEILKEIEDMEKWLSDRPDEEKTTTEAFDREEKPDSGIAMGPLAAQVEDLIGDLLEGSEEMEEAAQDSATDHAMSDFESGWDAIEGDIATFSADGISGNITPDHKEQDGRSIVGREGMSAGETAAGGGTLSEGDDNIEERRTEDPTQSGEVDIDGEGQTAATGGGKEATGKASETGMSGGVERMEGHEEGSWEGLAALMARQADAIYAQASLHNVKVDSLKEAAHHLRQSVDAVASGKQEQVKELQSLAISALRTAQVELEAGPTGSIEIPETPRLVDSFTGGGSDLAPERYKNAVADYYKLLNESL